MKNRNYIHLFANCLITKGISRSVICDLQRSKYVLIPNSFADLFSKQRYYNLKEAPRIFDQENLSIFHEYVAVLKDHNFIFSCSKKELKRFPQLQLKFEYPAKITNAIIDFDKNSNTTIKDIIQYFLIPYNCRHIQIRCFEDMDSIFFDTLITEINHCFIKSVEFIIKDSFEQDYTQIMKWVENNRKIKSLVLHSSQENKVIQKENYGFGIVVTTRQKITSESHCGIIHPDYFNITIESYTESLCYNSCLNRKISIDKSGNIKNCPSMKQSFGNIKSIKTLDSIIENPDFNKYWTISKDKIETCMYCEFRYICIDCRAYLETPENIYSKPQKCGYDPFTNKWKWDYESFTK
ncbi:grasp-with-spasm system SPASM domain peptide maturase [Flavobacterium supellecticarium]|uniref:Grasp-with-spasm system SPASM domain peptide maturase n=1 Tax=Flavobacterium supellecticarium TaxID=2565924 RepID=A0A4S3ZZV9_9FLAO|nr:grasp-with-spasm system SPASM domain peptide maturase [Flavobacterium supellecticarium]THF51402.1 grasp-with-spasm system SPASM domain peptide maturase [Flavobacterium supellecticarium]